MRGLEIRKAVANDSPFVYETKRAAFKEYVDQVFGWDEEQQHLLHRQRFVSQDFRIVGLNGKDVGILAVDIQADCVKLNQVFLAPEFQGLGIGKACMLQVMKEADQLKLPIHLQVLKVNPRARVFYERLGFVCTGETETHVLTAYKGEHNE